MRGRKASSTPMTSLHVRVPARLRREVDEELETIYRGEVPRGALSSLVTKLLQQWLKSRKENWGKND